MKNLRGRFWRLLGDLAYGINAKGADDRRWEWLDALSQACYARARRLGARMEWR